VCTAITTILPHHLTPIYNLLKQIQNFHPDEICRLHATATISNLGLIVKDLLEPEAEEMQGIVKLVKFL